MMTENLLIYDKNAEERKLLIRRIRDGTAYCSDAQIQLQECENLRHVKSHLQKEGALDLAVLEISNPTEIELAKDVRSRKERAEMMLVAEASISPMEYLTPEIRAASLLMRPYTEAQMDDVVRTYVTSFFTRHQDPSGELSIKIDGRSGMRSIPVSQIYYIEVSAKRIYIRLQDKEYSKSDSLENVRKLLPDTFMQCHRSYIFNTGYLEKVVMSENTIYLRHGITVPMARSYRQEIREYMNG